MYLHKGFAQRLGRAVHPSHSSNFSRPSARVSTSISSAVCLILSTPCSWPVAYAVWNGVKFASDSVVGYLESVLGPCILSRGALTTDCFFLRADLATYQMWMKFKADPDAIGDRYSIDKLSGHISYWYDRIRVVVLLVLYTKLSTIEQISWSLAEGENANSNPLKPAKW